MVSKWPHGQYQIDKLKKIVELSLYSYYMQVLKTFTLSWAEVS